jgi:hypothetical protein
MSQATITNITIPNNPSLLTDPFIFNVTFECFKPLPGNLDWRIVYLGIVENEPYDELID